MARKEKMKTKVGAIILCPKNLDNKTQPVR
jgi:hypothetical protein